MDDDPFPRERVAVMLRRVPAYLRLSWRLTREPLLSRARRAAVIGAAGYLASPIDLVPGVVPVLGQLDDLAVALAAIRFALAGLSPERRRFHLDAVGLADENLTADLRTIGATTVWLIRATARAAARGVRATGRAAQATGRAAQVGGRAAMKGATLAARASRVIATNTGAAARSAARIGRGRLVRLRDRAASDETLPVEHEGDATDAEPRGS